MKNRLNLPFTESIEIRTNVDFYQEFLANSGFAELFDIELV